MSDEVIFSRENQLGLIRLNRPQALNALNLSMIEAIDKQLRLWAEDAAIGAVVIDSVEGRAFCAGGDVRWIYEAGIEKDPRQLKFFEKEYKLNEYISRYPKPYIALMDGLTMGGGVGISLHGAYKVASPVFKFAMPETGIGFFPDIGASYILTHQCSIAMANFIGLSGRTLDAESAFHTKLISHVAASEDFAKIISTLAAADLSYNAHERIQSCLHDMAIDLPEHNRGEKQALIEDCFNQPSVEAIIKSLAQSDSEIAQGLLADLNQKSPFSLKVTFEQLHRAKDLTLRDCLRMDYVLVQHFMKGHDFYEGIRALLVDKDKNPRWQPESLDAVQEKAVHSYFQEDDLSLSFE